MWPDVIVNEESVTQYVSELRLALGDREHKIIKTIARRGYLCAVPVEQITEDDEAGTSRAASPSGSVSPSVQAIKQKSEQVANHSFKAEAADLSEASTSCERSEPLSISEPSRARTRAERRPLTTLFCGLTGSAASSGDLDPEDMSEVTGAYHACISGVIASHGGFVARFQSDGVLVYFGYPSANEFDAERAVRAGLATIEAVSDLKNARNTRLVARIGIATGLVVVDRPGGERADVLVRHRAWPTVCRRWPSRALY